MDESTKASRERHQREQDFMAANPKAHSFAEINTGKVLIPVFYDDLMVTSDGGVSPSAAKPKFAMGRWLADGQPINIIKPRPAKCEQFYRAHAVAYVDGVFSGLIENGFGSFSDSVAATLPYTTGSMIDATYEALHNGIGAVSPSSGFHHAGYAANGGFCTFNALMIVAAEFPFGRIGILDFDAHYGDGTDRIIRRRDVNNVVHYSQGQYANPDPDVFINGIEYLITTKFSDCDAVLYQAGADAHIDDPLGAGFLTTEQLFERDRIVFRTLRALKIPVVWNLAGGYQRPFSKVLDIHANTMTAFKESFYAK
jgi:acetoin utilization deacetylase AcuC-like enzyme